MKYTWLAAAASVAFIASGVVAQAQDNPSRDEKPGAERSETRPAAAPRAAAPKAERRDTAQTEERKDERAAPKEERRSEPMKPGAEPKADERAKKAEEGERTRTGAAEDRKRTGAAEDRTRTGATEDRTRTGAAEDRTPTGAAEDRSRTGAAEGHGEPRVMGKVQTSTEHATRVSEILMRNSQSENVDVDINVGVRVPDSVTIYPLPEEVLTIAPEYQGYDYFVDNGEVVFVAPETHEIVGAIEYGGATASVSESINVAGARPCPVN